MEDGVSAKEREAVRDIARHCFRVLRPDLLVVVGLDVDAFIAFLAKSPWTIRDDGAGCIHAAIGAHTTHGDQYYLELYRYSLKKHRLILPHLALFRWAAAIIGMITRRTCKRGGIGTPPLVATGRLNAEPTSHS